MKDCAKLDDVPVGRWKVKKGRPVAEIYDTGIVDCSWAHRKPPYALTMIKYRGSLYDEHIFTDAKPEEIEILGYPAWTGERKDPRPTCVLMIDTHDQQHLMIHYNVTGPIEDNTVNCDYLPEIGTELIEALER